MTEIVPTVGRMVLFKVSREQAETLNKRRYLECGKPWHSGNVVKEGSVYPAVIVAVWGDAPTSAVNLKVLLDGADDFWAPSVCVGEEPGTYHWMTYQKAVAAGELQPTRHEHKHADPKEQIRGQAAE